MLSVVITGNTGSGKSTLSNFLSEFGIDTICADKINADVFKYCRLVSHQTNKIINSLDMTKDNRVDKIHLRNIIFNRPLIKKAIESILHPIIYENMILQKSLHLEKSYIIFEIPLIFESQSKFEDVDIIILITSEYTNLKKRITDRLGISLCQAKNILSSQLADRNKFSASDAVVINSSTLESLRDSAIELDYGLRKFSQSLI